MKARPKLTLVQSHTSNQADVDENLDDEARHLADLRGELWGRAGRAGATFRSVAADAKLAPSTVHNFASGQTKRPQYFTLRRLANSLGYELKLTRMKRAK